MSETEIDFIDVAADTKRAKAAMSAREWREKYFKLGKVELSPKQAEFCNALEKFIYFRSGNQSGKSFGVATLAAYTATGRYPKNFTGWRPKVRTDSAYGIVIWVLSVTSQMTRDGMQTLLLGDVAGGNTGTGLIPKESILSIQMGRGVAGFVDYAVIQRDDGVLCKLAFKTYEQGRSAVQAEPVSLVILDELLDDLPMFNELIARTTATSGVIRMTATERLQASPVAIWFRENAGPDCALLQMTVDDATHLTQEEKDNAKSQYKSEAELQTRYYGQAFQGGGGVFTIPISEITEPMDPAMFPVWYKYLIACDFSHFGRSETSSQFAAVFMAVDHMNGVVRIFDAFKMRGLVEQHVARILSGGGRGMRVAWPSDGTQGQADGTNIMTQYKKAGLTMLPTHAQFENGGINFESGIALMDQMFLNGKLRIATHLKPLLDEYLQYERDEDGKVIKRQDDLLSALRFGCMSIRFARGLEEQAQPGKASVARMARDIEFNLFDPQQPIGA